MILTYSLVGDIMELTRKEYVMEFQPVKPTFECLFQATVNVGAPAHISKVPLGERRYVPITGGSSIGEKLSGDVLPRDEEGL
jgi:hypothetical protein